MRIRILLSLLAFSVLLGGINNLVNTNRVEWSGTPRVFPKPEGWPTLTFSQGVSAGVKHAVTEVRTHVPLVAGAVVLLAVLAFAGRKRSGSPARGIKSWWRLVFALMFLAAAWPKFTDPYGFASLVAQYQMLPPALVHVFSVWLPAMEITVGLSLLLLPYEKESSALLGLLLVMFIVALTQALARGLGIACGCFDLAGATDAGETWFALLRDIVLLVPAFWLWRRAEKRALWNL